MSDDIRKNGSGYPDRTAYEAIKNVDQYYDHYHKEKEKKKDENTGNTVITKNAWTDHKRITRCWRSENA